MAAYCMNLFSLSTIFIISMINASPILQGQEVKTPFPSSSLVESTSNTTSVSFTGKKSYVNESGQQEIKSGVASVINNVSSVFNRSQVVNLGETCEDDLQCYQGTIGAICSGLRCVCSHLYIEEEGYCVPKRMASHTDDPPCQEDSQCVAIYGNRTVCMNNICQCDRDFHPYGGKCLPDLKLGDSCSIPYDCIVSKFTEEPNQRECFINKCTCKIGSIVSDNLCLRGYGYQLEASLAWLVCIFILPYYFNF